MSSLGGKCALITGSSRGIGRGIALKLAENGVKVGIHYFPQRVAAKDTLAKVRKRGSDGFLIQADVTDPEQITRMVARRRRNWGSSTSTSAMRAPRCPSFSKQPLKISLDQWDAAFDSQAKGSSWGARGERAHGHGRQDLRHHLCPWQPHRRAAAVGRHGLGQSGVESLVATSRSAGQAWYHRQCDQPGWTEDSVLTRYHAGSDLNQEIGTCAVGHRWTPGTPEDIGNVVAMFCSSKPVG